MANWTPSSLAGKMFQLTAKYVPPPPGVPPPSLWGDEGTVRERLQGTSEIVTTRRAVVINYPFPPAAVVDLFRRYFGPTQKAFEVLDEGGQKAMAAECERLFAANNEATDGTTRLAMDFLEVRARRAN